jgi:hypothetical protein
LFKIGAGIPRTPLTPAPLVIPDLETGLQILSCLPLADAQQADIQLNRFLDSLLLTPPPAAVYLKLLEQSRLSLCFVEEALAQRYVNQSLPLASLEESYFRQVVATWLKAASAYAHCAQLETSADDAAHSLRLSLILHRCIYYTGMAIIEHHRARRELPPGLWLDLHGYYASAEEWGLALLAIPDALDPQGRSTHCTAAFVSFLLSELAGPYSLSVRDQRLVHRWAGNLAPLVSVRTVTPGEPLPQFVVDLMHDVGLSPVAECLQTEQLRRLDTGHLAMHLGQLRQQLDQKMSPAQIGLGEDCTAGQCRQLLDYLSRPWSQARAPRKFRRRATSGIAKLCGGFEAMHYVIAKAEFVQPENVRLYSRQEFDSLFTFRHMVDPTQSLQIHQTALDFNPDSWEVVNQSANGFRLMRSIVGKKMMHGQLLAVCPHDGEHYLLAQTSWLMQEQSGGLIAGIAALPGIPQAVAARPLAPQGGHAEMYSRAFILPAIPAVNVEQTLILPHGWYQAARLIELYTDKAWRVELRQVVNNGPDFERVSFAPVT